MPFQDDQFRRNQNFTRDRDLGAPDNRIQAELVDNEFDNVRDGLSDLSQRLTNQESEIVDAYSKTEADARFLEAEGALLEVGALAKAGDTTTGSLTLGGKEGANKGTISSGTVTFDYADGNVQTIVVDGPVTFAFANLPASGGALQINIDLRSGAITVSGTTWWEMGGGEKSTSFADLDVELVADRPYRMIVEMVAGYRTGIFQ